ncbi:hypothetical protein [Lentilactobacillus sp. SPB1-3]|uniref:Uncharacterized protein n=1 Tax=Lentilactobacillus terminaliae TaxID=3003483 RepID=A0ACD5DDW7_9LACO|nr:hypothetical protein [Lentilactobacillus sp. SPB1-3]MCZ0977457.1 hypothetical protein [Lentilactobacillus sp. SPB1-3]
MKKVILWSTIVLGMLGILATSTTTANAATWHKGVPTILKAGFWKDEDSKDYWGFDNHGVYYIDIKNVYSTNHPMYRKSGKSYTIKSMMKDHKYTYSTLTRINHNKFRFYYPHDLTDHDLYYTYLNRVYSLK